MIEIRKDWRYVLVSGKSFSVFAGDEYICETETEESARLICKLPEFYDMLKEFIDSELNPDFDYRRAEKFIERIEGICRL